MLLLGIATLKRVSPMPWHTNCSQCLLRNGYGQTTIISLAFSFSTCYKKVEGKLDLEGNTSESQWKLTLTVLSFSMVIILLTVVSKSLSWVCWIAVSVPALLESPGRTPRATLSIWLFSSSCFRRSCCNTTITHLALPITRWETLNTYHFVLWFLEFVVHVYLKPIPQLDHACLC